MTENKQTVQGQMKVRAYDDKDWSAWLRTSLALFAKWLERYRKVWDARSGVGHHAHNGPARIVFDAWTKPELVRRWWAPKSRGLSVISCDADVRPGGKYPHTSCTRRRKCATVYSRQEWKTGCARRWTSSTSSFRDTVTDG